MAREWARNESVGPSAVITWTVSRLGQVVTAILIAVPLLVSFPPVSGAYTRLPLRYMQDMVVDAAHEQIFITGGEDDPSIVVADYGGKVVDRIDLSGAAIMELAGDSLYVSQNHSSAVYEIDTATREIVRTLHAGADTVPGYLAKVGNFLWFSDCGSHGLPLAPSSSPRGPYRGPMRHSLTRGVSG
jgi:hypothetical protein